MPSRLIALLLLLGVSSIAARVTAEASDPMAAAANAFLAALSAEQRAACVHDFDDAERRNWQPVPFGEAGVRLDAMTEAQRKHARGLLQSVLSADGLATVDGVLLLERILVELETAAGRPSRYHGAGRYFFTVYGDPGAPDPWAWRVEGHHLSMTFTCRNDAWTAHGPLFVGSQPARVKGGEHDGFRLLGPKDDNVRGFVARLSAPQRAKAVQTGALPGNILLVPGEDEGFETSVGVGGADLTAGQRAELLRIVSAWARWLRRDLAEAEIARMKAGLSETAVLWMGGTGVDEPHYWRITGPHFAIEYNAMERDPDHVHAVWRDVENDFGGALLRRHLEEHHSGSGQ
jgi:hypothetical protein